MKNAILKGVVGVVVVLATAGGVYVGALLPAIIRGWKSFANESGLVNFFFWLQFLLLLWIWAMLVGGFVAGFWRRRGFAPEIALPFSLVATLLVFGPSLLMLLGGSAVWSSSYGVAGRIVALASLSFFPSQVACWGFAVVMRIGWKRQPRSTWRTSPS
jgi:hypothetical protein